MTSADSQRPAQFTPSIELIVKFAALPGLVAYAVLFLAYRRYYSSLGLTPEEVGVNTAYVLSRSLGLAGLVAIFAALASLSVYLERRFPTERAEGDGSWSRASNGIRSRLTRLLPQAALAVRLLLTALLASFMFSLYSPDVPFVAVACALALLGFVTLPESDYSRFGSSQRIVRLAVGPMVGVVVIATALNSYAHHQAVRLALEGCAVQSLEFFGVTILDISAIKARIDWVGVPEQRPSVFPDAAGGSAVEGLLVGRGSQLSFLQKEGDAMTLAQVPSTLATVQITPRSADSASILGGRCQAR